MQSDYEHSKCQSTASRRWWIATRTYVAECPSGKVGSQVSETRQARSYLSQADADEKALLAAKTAALAQLSCVFSSTKTFTAHCPNNLGIINTAFATRHSAISHADADAKALAAAKRLAYSGLTCYRNTEQSYTAHCPTGWVGTPIVRTVDADTFSSGISQADADMKALNQARADALGDLECEEPVDPPSGTVFWNSEQTAIARCPAGQTGFPIIRGTPANTFSSTVSQADADAQALAAAAAAARALLVCYNEESWVNQPQTATAFCPDGTIGEFTATIPAGTITSDISQADANAAAYQLAVAQAQSQLVCQPIYYNTEQSYTANCPECYEGDPQTVTIPMGQVSSLVSQSDADNTALSQAQAQAQSQLSCEFPFPQEPLNITVSVSPSDGGAAQLWSGTLAFNSFDSVYIGTISGASVLSFSAMDVQISRIGEMWVMEFEPSGGLTHAETSVPGCDPNSSYPDTISELLAYRGIAMT